MTNTSNGKLTPTKEETIHLRVYIHCEGCKKKVNKILTKIEGVSTVEIDASLGKVTVTSTVDLQTLVKKLQKSGKAVQLWPAPQPIKSAPPTPQPKEATKETTKGKDQKEDQPQPSPQKPAADDATADNAMQDDSKANSSKKKMDNMEKKKQSDKDVTPGDQEGNKKANKKNNNGGGDNGSKSGSGNNENNNKPKLIEANGDATPHLNGGPAASSSKNNQANNNGGGTPNANNKKKSNVASEVDAENVVSPQISVSANVEKGSKSSSKKKGGEDGVAHSTETNMDDLFVDASPTRSTANKHMAPPPMVLVETSEYSADMESTEDYATHMFSDENANNCTLM